MQISKFNSEMASHKICEITADKESIIRAVLECRGQPRSASESAVISARDRLADALQFTPPDLLVQTLGPLSALQLGLCIGYDSMLIENLDSMLENIAYTECFPEFYQCSKLIPLLGHGDGRHFDLLDTVTGAIVQFNVMDPPSEWLVLSTSFEQSVDKFYKALAAAVTIGTPLPSTVYSEDGPGTISDLYPDRATELDDILPDPLVLRTNAAGTWQMECKSDIHKRLENGDDVEWLTSHLEHSPEDIRKKTSMGNEPLHIAARNGRARCAAVLMSTLAAADGGVLAGLRAANSTGETPLLAAASSLCMAKNNSFVFDCVLDLIAAGSDVNASQCEGATVLHLAAAAAAPSVVQAAIIKGANASALTSNKYGAYTPLHHLCSSRGGFIADEEDTLSRLLKCAQLLLDAGANPDSRGHDGSSPLHLLMWGSSMGDMSELIRFLVKAGADVSACAGVMKRSVIDSGFARDKYGPLLRELGAVDKPRNAARTTSTVFTSTIGPASFDKKTPVLRTANAVMGQTASDAIRGFQAYGCADVLPTGNLPPPPSLLALVKLQLLDLVRERLSAGGCDPNAAEPCDNGVRPLVYATNAGLADITEALLAAGADPCLVDAEGFAPIHGAQPECLNQLLNAGADPNALDKFGQSPLSLAIDFYPLASGKLEYCTKLIQYGASLDFGVSITTHLTPREAIEKNPDLNSLLEVTKLS